LSPQTRRGRAVPPSHRKSSSHAAPSAGTPAVAAPIADKPVADVKAGPVRAGRRRGVGISRVRKSAGARYATGFFGAYMPLIVGFVVLFAGVWVYLSFVNPPPPQPQERWTQIESKYVAKINAARLEINSPKSDFATRIQGFKDYSAALKAWMSELATIPDWTVGALPSASADFTNAKSDIQSMIAQGNQEALLLDQVATSKSEAEIGTYTTQLAAYNETFEGFWAAVAVDMLLKPVDQPTLALPATPTPAPSDSAGASGSPAAVSSPPPAAVSSPSPS
jgi:hypothetical protein